MASKGSYEHGLRHNRSSYSAARHEAVVEAVRAGNFRATAARLAGVAPNTLYRWLDRGEAASEAQVPYDDPELGAYRRLYEEVEEAEALFESEMVGKVVDAAEEKEWTAAMAILERTRPHKFAKRNTFAIEGGAQPVKLATLHLISSPEAIEQSNALLRTLARPAEREPRSIEAELARVAESARVRF